MKWLAGPEIGWDGNLRENNLPPVKSVANVPKFREVTPLTARWLEKLKIDKMKPLLGSPLVAHFNTKRGEWGTEVIRGEVWPQQALDELQKDVETQVKNSLPRPTPCHEPAPRGTSVCRPPSMPWRVHARVG
jgi:hypothetical protein